MFLPVMRQTVSSLRGDTFEKIFLQRGTVRDECFIALNSSNKDSSFPFPDAHIWCHKLKELSLYEGNLVIKCAKAHNESIL